MDKHQRKITFITAAYGKDWHRIVKGLARTFSQSNPSKLIIYTDATDLDLPGCNIENSLSIETLQKYSGNLPFRSSKTLILSHAAKKYGNICWIDADMLVYTDLSAKLDADKINVISYGYGDQLRNCGGDLKIPQYQYSMSGIFAAPREYIFQFEQIWLELKDSIAKSVTLYDQSVLNHLIARNKKKVRYLTTEYTEMIWNFEKFHTNEKAGAGHPTPTNINFCKDLRLKNHQLYYKKTPFAVLYWTSKSLLSQLDSQFIFIHNRAAREHLIQLYQ